MFITLLFATLAIAVVVAALVARAFASSIRKILARLVGDALAPAWARYIRFAILVVGISGGVRIHALERYLADPVLSDGEAAVPMSGGSMVLTGERWVLEVYGTLIGTLQAVAWLLLVFFLTALVAYVILRGVEVWGGRREQAQG